MATAVLSSRLSRATTFADAALGASARLWFMAAVIGQLVFVLSVAAFYSSAALRGDLQAWNKFMPHAYVAGDSIGNVAVGVHLFAAVFIVLSGALQLVPQVRLRAPSLHRWNGRLYMVSAFTVSGAGLYMSWVRGSVGDLSQKLGISLNAVLVMLFAAMALRTAMARDFKTHRRWALRLFLVVGGVWFVRISLALSLVLNRGPFGFDPTTFTGPFLTFLSFAAYLFPLCILELYLRAEALWSGPGRIAMATALAALTIAMSAGIFAASIVFWVPRIKAAFDSRKSIDQVLAATIVSKGIDAAVRQYHQLHAAEPASYNFDEPELNALGYTLIHARAFADAICIFQLNAAAYPRSSNAYDSLAEAYLVQGDTAQAIVNYQTSLRLDPDNRGAAEMLQRLSARQTSGPRSDQE
jgi:uncharacterized membrane protein